MRRKSVFLINLVIIISILSVTPKLQKLEASGTIYIWPDGSIYPPTAPIQKDGDLYTINGNITSDADGIIVYKNNTVIDGAGYTLQGTGNGEGIYLAITTNVTTKNMIITTFYSGIYFSNGSSNNNITGNCIKNNACGIEAYGSSNNNTISANYLTNNTSGIRMERNSSNNIIVDNNITAGNGYGIYLGYSTNNRIAENNIKDNMDGIWLYSSSSNSIIGNNITANDMYGIRIEESSNNNITGNTLVKVGLFVKASYGNTVEDNFVNGKPLVYLEGVSNYTVTDAGQVILVNCDDIRVESLNLTNTTLGLELWRTNNCKVANNSIAKNWYGIKLVESSNNSIIENGIKASNWFGIWFDASSNNSMVRNHIANHYTGVWLNASSNNKIIGNNITENNHWGMVLHESSNNSICKNNMTKNKDDEGISLYAYSSFNNVSENYIAENHLNGISLLTSSKNSIIGNNVTANNCDGIMLDFNSNYNSIQRNYITANKNDGIDVSNSSDNGIVGNEIAANELYGIKLSSSSNNSIVGNDIKGNDGGISLTNSSNNKFYHNNFTGNTHQVYDYSWNNPSVFPSINVWDDGAEGNYWSDYEERYPNATEIDDSGIWDTPYVIDSNNQDRFPLIPELPSFLIMPLFMTATLLAIMLCKRKDLSNHARVE
jgi:parallel beta-helix repeat protein